MTPVDDNNRPIPPISVRELNHLIDYLTSESVELVTNFDPTSEYILDTYVYVDVLAAQVGDWRIEFFVDGGGLDYIQRIKCKSRQTLEYDGIPEVLSNYLFELLYRKLYPPTEEEKAAAMAAMMPGLERSTRALTEVFMQPSPLVQYLKNKGMIKKL
jgi:hypothetical protein